MENQNEELPQDIQNEILLRMPVKSLGKCICVSKEWAAIIRGRNFRDLYFLRSMTKPRLLFQFYRRDDSNVLFQSVYQEKVPLLSSGHQQSRITLEPGSLEVCAVTGGLVCIKTSTSKIVLCNPCTNKFLALPELRERDKDGEVTFVETFLGYDEATNVFKVLCLTSKLDYRVFTVGSCEDCWRTIVYESEHIPVTKGLCLNGVLYYGAVSISDYYSIVISFNLRSEKLNVIELPSVKLDMFDTSLVNYKGEIALVDRRVDENGEIKFLVRNEVAGVFRKERIVIPRWRETVGDLGEYFCFKGTIGTGELVFALDKYHIQGSMFVLYYDTITQHLRKFEIDGFDSDCYVDTFLDHFDSLSLM